MYITKCILRKDRCIAVGVFFSFMFCLCMQAAAASFDISPIRIFLDEKVKLEKLIVKNVSDAEFPIQINAYEWSQNDKGEDVYSETKDIITFPKIISIKKGEEKIIRIGTNIHPGAQEKTYRIYVEEMPVPVKEEKGTTIRFFMRVGIPVFIKPLKIENNADIENIEMVNGKLKIKLKNNGNSHFIVTGINVSGKNDEGKERFVRDIGGWYLLRGSRKIYETPIPAEVCASIANLNVEVKTNKTTLKKEITMDKTMCGSVDHKACGPGSKELCHQVGMTYGY